MTKLEIIEDTVNYYTEDPSLRAFDLYEGCSYITRDGRKCAVGRYLKCPSKWEVISGDVIYLAKFANFDDDEFIPEAQGHNIQFWSALQMFHDDGTNWCESGLSEDGKHALQGLKRMYDTDSEG